MKSQTRLPNKTCIMTTPVEMIMWMREISRVTPLDEELQTMAAKRRRIWEELEEVEEEVEMMYILYLCRKSSKNTKIKFKNR